MTGKIKVIKKYEAAPAAAPKRKKPTPAAAARDMVSTVSDWVTEIKDRKREETKRAIDQLFSQHAQPSES
jgi:hypothetical protein